VPGKKDGSGGTLEPLDREAIVRSFKVNVEMKKLTMPLLIRQEDRRSRKGVSTSGTLSHKTSDVMKSLALIQPRYR
jgi:hypothetical protein